MIAKTYILLVIITCSVWVFNNEIKFLIRLAFLICGYDLIEKKFKGKKAKVIEPKQKVNNG